VTLVYFAWVRQKIGVGEEKFDLPSNVKTVRDLIEHLQTRGRGYFDAFAEPARLRAAVNQEHVIFETPISNSDEVAFFPPVTGG
jgi:molybdopterin synthase sulfur carrier subunit